MLWTESPPGMVDPVNLQAVRLCCATEVTVAAGRSRVGIVSVRERLRAQPGVVRYGCKAKMESLKYL